MPTSQSLFGRDLRRLIVGNIIDLVNGCATGLAIIVARAIRTFVTRIRMFPQPTCGVKQFLTFLDSLSLILDRDGSISLTHTKAQSQKIAGDST